MDKSPVLLDLFCGAGGAATGYSRAGFRVIGVDIKPQPNYPFEFHQADALAFLRGSTRLELIEKLDAIHASPPCQWGTAYRRRPNHVKDSVNIVDEVRELLRETGLPYVIEQPESNRAALELGPAVKWEGRGGVTLCGSSFGLDVRRHRCFETSFDLCQPPCDHSWQTPRFPQATNRVNLRSTVEVGVYRIPLAVQKVAMGVDWDVTLHELSEAIPPAYTEYLGSQLLNYVEAAA